MRRWGFTLIELIVAVALMLIAVGIALQATVGSNNASQRTALRSQLVEAARETANSLRTSTTLTSISNLSIISGVSYPDASTDLNPGLTKEPVTSTNPGFAVEVRQFGQAQVQTICSVIGRIDVKTAAGGQPLFFLSPTGSAVGIIIFPLNDTGNCQYSTILYRGQLSDSLLKVQVFEVMLRKIDYSCGSNTCSVGQLRHHLQIKSGITFQTAQNAITPSIDVVGSLPIGLK